MAQLELTYHQMFPEDCDRGWYAGQLPDGRRLHAAAILCQPANLHWAGGVEDPDACECEHAGTCNLCLIRQDGGLVFTRVTGCYRSANSAVRALQHWAQHPEGPQPPVPPNSWTTSEETMSRPTSPPSLNLPTEPKISSTKCRLKESEVELIPETVYDDGDHPAFPDIPRP